MRPTTKEQIELSPPLVYIREVAAEELTDTLRKAGVQLDNSAILYAVHLETGERMAVFSERDAAFEAARYHGATPVSVH